MKSFEKVQKENRWKFVEMQVLEGKKTKPELEIAFQF